MRIATWNINSVRMRAGLLARLDALAAPDVVCLQETKVVDELFPHIYGPLEVTAVVLTQYWLRAIDANGAGWSLDSLI